MIFNARMAFSSGSFSSVVAEQLLVLANAVNKQLMIQLSARFETEGRVETFSGEIASDFFLRFRAINLVNFHHKFVGYDITIKTDVEFIGTDKYRLTVWVCDPEHDSCTCLCDREHLHHCCCGEEASHPTVHPLHVIHCAGCCCITSARERKHRIDCPYPRLLGFCTMGHMHNDFGIDTSAEEACQVAIARLEMRLARATAPGLGSNLITFDEIGSLVAAGNWART